MAAAEYYGSAPPHDLNRFEPPSSTSEYDTRPHQAPYQGAFPPTHSGGYNDDLSYASTHYHKHSIDTSYDPVSYSSQNQPSAPSKHESQYAENIPLQDTRHHSVSAAEGGGFPPEKRRKHRSHLPRERRPWFCYIVTLVQIGVFCGQLAKNAQLTKSPIATSPFNPMIGPEFGVLINMGARFVPCMKLVKGFNDQTVDFSGFPYLCPQKQTPGGAEVPCTMKEWCGFGGNNVPDTIDQQHQPNQWYRFIVPMFLHAGVVHLAFNMLLQVILGGDMERIIGPARFAVIYFSSGIFGFILGGTLAPRGQPSVGASGCLFGVFALALLDIFYTWHTRASPVKDLIFLLLDIVISFVLGLLPFIDNFAHMGGFVCGLALGLVFLDTPERMRQRIGLDTSDPPYTPAMAGNPYNSSSGDSNLTGFRGFLKQPAGFFKGRKPAWWAWWLVRAATLAVILIALIVMLNNFYKYQKECSWCKYLNCLPINNWCDNDSLQLKNVTVNDSNSPRNGRRSIDMVDLLEFI